MRLIPFQNADEIALRLSDERDARIARSVRRARMALDLALFAVAASACQLAHLCAGTALDLAVMPALALATCAIGIIGTLRLFR